MASSRTQPSINSPDHPRPNHRQLAEICGVSTATISRALAGHPHVRQAVRDQILAEAQRLGYQPDPRLAYLSRLRWDSGRSPDSVRVVVLVDRFTGASLEHGKFQALQQTATELGYEVEIQHAEAVRAQGPQLSRQYYHRGIQGLLVSMHTTDALPDLDWERFSLVIVGEEYTDKPFHRVGTDWRQAFDLMSRKMLERGRHVGFCLVRYSGSHHNAGTELNRVILAEALLQREELSALGRGNAPLFQFDEDDPVAPARFVQWLDQHGIVTLFCNDLTPARWLREGAVATRQIPEIYLLPWTPGAEGFGISGCDLQLGERLSLGLRLLHDNLLLDRRGFANLPTKTLVPVKWVDCA